MEAAQGLAQAHCGRSGTGPLLRSVCPARASAEAAGTACRDTPGGSASRGYGGLSGSRGAGA